VYRKILILTIFISAAAIASCNGPSTGGSSGLTGSNPELVAIVGDSQLKIGDLVEDQGFRDAVQQKVFEYMLKDKLAREHKALTQEDYDEGLKKLKARFGTPEEFEQQLKMMGQTEEDVKRQMTISFAMEKLLRDRIVISDEDLRDYFDTQHQMVIQKHGANARLTQEETEKLTFEDVKETARNMLFDERASTEGQTVIKEIVLEYKGKIKLMGPFQNLKFNWTRYTGEEETPPPPPPAAAEDSDSDKQQSEGESADESAKADSEAGGDTEAADEKQPEG